VKTIVISPYSKPLRSGDGENPKNYPWWDDVVRLLRDHGFYIIQIGVHGEREIDFHEKRFNLPFKDLKETIKNCDCWISVDNMTQHLATYINKKGIVIFSKSDQRIFGYDENINLLKDRKYLRKYQFAMWEDETFQEEAFVKPEEIIKAVLELTKGN